MDLRNDDLELKSINSMSGEIMMYGLQLYQSSKVTELLFKIIKYTRLHTFY